MDPRAFRDAMGCFATGVCIATAKATGDAPAVGVTVNSFTSLSLDPPLVLFCLDKKAESTGLFEKADGFALSILADDQRALSQQFAGGPLEQRFADAPTETWSTGHPVIKGALAAMECAPHALSDGGDHVIVIGRVLRLSSRSGMPLLYFRGLYRTMDAA
jgi:flavin reductase (DIM6/NTAB) family NADH-FMN oxidoreductase RutF